MVTVDLHVLTRFITITVLALSIIIYELFCSSINTCKLLTVAHIIAYQMDIVSVYGATVHITI